MEVCVYFSACSYNSHLSRACGIHFLGYTPVFKFHQDVVQLINKLLLFLKYLLCMR